MEEYFTKEKVEDLINNHDWELKPMKYNSYRLEQKGKNYMCTVCFSLDENIAKKYLEGGLQK